MSYSFNDFILRKEVVNPKNNHIGGIVKQRPPCSKCAEAKKPGCYHYLGNRILSSNPGEERFWKNVEKEGLELLSVKSELSNLDVQKWSEFTDSLFPGSAVKPRIREMMKSSALVPPEMLTNAWLKLWEILETYDLVKGPLSSSLRTLHLGECPGAFIAATNHFIKTRLLSKEEEGIASSSSCTSSSNELHRKGLWQWKAVSLDPYHELNAWQDMLDNDTFYKETYGHWLRGWDGTGNLLKRKNVEHIVGSLLNSGWRCKLVTADGSFSTQHDPGHQEELVFPLLISQTLVALRALDVGGNYVLKCYSLLTPCSLGLLALISNSFSKVSLHKPFLSKPGNSEIYIVAEEFVGISSALYDACFNGVLEKPPLAEGTWFIPEASLSVSWMEGAAANSVRAFAVRQKETIQTALSSFQRNLEPNSVFPFQKKKAITRDFIDRLHVNWIDPNLQIVPHAKGNDLHFHKLGNRLTIGSTFTERLEDMGSWKQLLLQRESVFVHKPTGEEFICSFDINTKETNSRASKRRKVDTSLSEGDGDDLNKLDFKWFKLSSKIVQMEPMDAKYGDGVEKCPVMKPFRIVSSPYFTPDEFVSLLYTRVCAPNSLLPLSYQDLMSLWGLNFEKEKMRMPPTLTDSPMAESRAIDLAVLLLALQVPVDYYVEMSGYPSPLTPKSKVGGLPTILQLLKVPGVTVDFGGATTGSSSFAFSSFPHHKVLPATALEQWQSLPVQIIQILENKFPNLIIVDVSGHPIKKEILQNEIEEQKRLCRAVYVSLKSLNSGGTLILSLSSTATRFTGSLLVLLASVFDQISFWQSPFVAPWRQQRYICCKQLNKGEALDVLKMRLKEALLILEKGKMRGIGVSHLTAPEVFMDEEFSDWLTKCNVIFAKREIASIESALDLAERDVEKESFEITRGTLEGLESWNSGNSKRQVVASDKEVLILKRNEDALLLKRLLKLRSFKVCENAWISIKQFFELENVIKGAHSNYSTWLQSASPKFSIDLRNLSKLPTDMLGYWKSLNEEKLDYRMSSYSEYKNWGFRFITLQSQPSASSISEFDLNKAIFNILKD